MFPSKKFLLPFVLVVSGCIAAITAQAQSNYEPYGFTTLAGSPFGPGSANGTGSAARFYNPAGVAVDGTGNVYVADTLNHTIRKITPAAVVTTLAGLAGNADSTDGAGSLARFKNPSGLAVDANGNVYVADTGNHTIRKIAPNGAVTTFAGAAGAAGYVNRTGNAARFNTPVAVALDTAGNVYVADSRNSAIRKITPLGAVSTLAGVNSPKGVAVDRNGYVYASGNDNNYHIYKVSPAGTTTVLAGSFTEGHDQFIYSADGPGDVAVFTEPAGLAVNNEGDVFVADSGNNSIRKVTPDGTVSTIAGLGSDEQGPGCEEDLVAYNSGSADGVGSTARFYLPHGVAVTSSGTLYVADTSNDTIRKITPTGVVSTFAGLPTSAGYADGAGKIARFASPAGVAIDSARNVYVADGGNAIIRKITPTNIVSTLAGTAHHFAIGPCGPPFSGPTGVAVDPNGIVYTADPALGVINIGEYIFAGERFNSGFQPSGIATDSAGNVYMANMANHTIRKITPDGVASLFAGKGNQPGSADGTTSARFRSPHGVAVDKFGTVFVADTGNNTIRKITPNGVVSTFAGLAGNLGNADGTGSTARFNAPQGIAVGGAGYVYVADTGNNTIRRITPGGVVTTLGGVVGMAGSADGLGSVARFNSPTGIAVDSLGAIYVADSDNNTIRVGRRARIETEALKVQSITPRPAGITAAQWFGVFSASAASSGAGSYFNAIASSNYITYTVPITQPGTYRVRVGVQTKSNKGVFQLAINGVNQGQPQDEYDPSLKYNLRSLGKVYLNSGNQAFKFTVTGKNASSSGYTLAFDYIELVP